MQSERSQIRGTILIVDDDATFRQRLVKAMAERGFQVFDAPDAGKAVEIARREKPERAVVDLRLAGRSGLEVVSDLTGAVPGIQIVMLTGYGSIATAVEAVRRGAINYLNKPADAEQILAAFEREAETDVPIAESSPSLARVEWEHVQRVLTECKGNISEASRKLGIHRRSLQRKLAKLPPLE